MLSPNTAIAPSAEVSSGSWTMLALTERGRSSATVITIITKLIAKMAMTQPMTVSPDTCLGGQAMLRNLAGDNRLTPSCSPTCFQMVNSTRQGRELKGPKQTAYTETAPELSSISGIGEQSEGYGRPVPRGGLPSYERKRGIGSRSLQNLPSSRPARAAVSL
jgi:hypothetical protein